MIFSYPGSPNRIIVLLKTLRHIIEDLKKKSEREERSGPVLERLSLNTSNVSKLQHESYQRQHTQSYRAYYGVSKDKQMVTNEIYCSHVFDQILVISTNQHATTSRDTNWRTSPATNIIIIEGDLQWDSHVREVKAKATKIFGPLRRNLSHCSYKVK